MTYVNKTFTFGTMFLVFFHKKEGTVPKVLVQSHLHLISAFVTRLVFFATDTRF